MKLKDDEGLLIRRYLLGRLSQDEQAKVEDRLMTERPFLYRIEYAEEVLRDDYARGRLSIEDVRDFEASFAHDPERHQDVEFARALSGYARAVKTQASEAAQEKWWRTAFIFTGFIKPEPARRARIKPYEVSLALIPGLVRGGGHTSSIVIPANTKELRLELILERGKNYQAYRAELRTVEGEVIDRQENLEAEQTSMGQVLPLSLPAASLSENDYILMLSGKTVDNLYEKVGTYFFVIREHE